MTYAAPALHYGAYCSEGYTLKNKVKNPLPSGYCPELDIFDELGLELALQFMQLIGILQWAVELGQIDIYLEVLLIALTLPGEPKDWTS